MHHVTAHIIQSPKILSHILNGRWHGNSEQYQLVGSEELMGELQRNSEEAEARNDSWSVDGNLFIYRHLVEVSTDQAM